MEGLKGSTVVVTGGAGFIGSHLVDKLVTLGARIHVVDLNNPRTKAARAHIVDIRNRTKLIKTLTKIRPHFVFHLAADALVTTTINDPIGTFETNIMGTAHVLEAAREIRVIKGVIVASSDKAYGKTKRAYTESSPLAGDHPYEVSKSSADLIAQTYAKSYELPVVITRFGNVYGEGDVYFDRLIPGICQAIVRNGVFNIRSDGTFVRDYLYVKDVVEGYILLARNIGKTRGQAYNFSSCDTLSVLDVIRKIEKTLDLKIKYKILGTARNEIPYQHLNDAKARELGWKNKYTLASTIPSIIAWYHAYEQDH